MGRGPGDAHWAARTLRVQSPHLCTRVQPTLVLGRPQLCGQPASQSARPPARPPTLTSPWCSPKFATSRSPRDVRPFSSSAGSERPWKFSPCKGPARR